MKYIEHVCIEPDVPWCSGPNLQKLVKTGQPGDDSEFFAKKNGTDKSYSEKSQSLCSTEFL